MASESSGKLESIKSKPFKTSHKMLDWQYFQILGELQEIQRHDSDPTCPCRLSDDLGENCLAKHSLGLSVIAAETAAMDEVNSKMLLDLSAEAKERHEAMKDFLCHTKDAPEFTRWSRHWRKKIEPLYYHASCKVKLHQDKPVVKCSLKQPEYPLPSSQAILLDGEGKLFSDIVPEEYQKFKVDLQLNRHPGWSLKDSPQMAKAEDLQPLFRKMRLAEREYLLVILVDTKNRLVGLFEQSIGTHDYALVDPLEIVRIFVKTNASAVFLAHNHPSGDPLLHKTTETFL